MDDDDDDHWRMHAYEFIATMIHDSACLVLVATVHDMTGKNLVSWVDVLRHYIRTSSLGNRFDSECRRPA